MKRLLALGVFGLVMVMSVGVFTGGSAVSCAMAEDTLVAAASDGEVKLCPLCGKPMTPGHVHEEEKEGLPFSVGTDHAFLSKYVWRGLDVTDEAVWQPDVWVSAYGFTFNVWANMDLTDVNDNQGEFNEVDYTLNYAGEYEKLSYTAGVIGYQFPNTPFDTTWEVYGSLGYDIILNPTVTVYYDFDEADGFYGMFGLSHSFGLPQVSDAVSMSLDLSGHAGLASKNWNNFYYGADHTAFVDLVIGASLPVAIGDHLTVSPTVTYSTVLDKTLRTKTDNNDNVVWGVVLSASM